MGGAAGGGDSARASDDPIRRSLTYELAVEAAEIGAWDRDCDTNVVTVCPIMARMLELPPGYHILQPSEWRDTILPEDLPAVEQAMADALREDRPFNLEFRIRLPSGRILWQISRGKYIKDGAGRPVRITGVSLDITEKKNTELALVASEQRFRMLSELSPDGILVVANGVVAYANRAACRMFDVTGRGTMIGQSAYGFFAPEGHDEMRTWLTQAMTQDRTGTFTTLRMRTRNGSEKFVQCTSGRVLWEAEPAVQLLLRDVTEQKRAEDKLRVMQERLSFAVGGIGEAIWDWDIPNQTFTYSGGLHDVVKCTREDSFGRMEEWSKSIHPDDLERVITAFQAAIEDKVPIYECEYRLRAADGSWRWVWARGVIVERDENGRPLTMTGTLTDTTARKESEELVWRHANLDPLTALPNRRMLRERLDTEVSKAQRAGDQLAVLFLDLDGFKQVNDVFGHDAGDNLLLEAAHRIQGCVRHTDIVARLGGDEFMVVLTGLHHANHVEFVCQEILIALEKPFQLGTDTAYVTASIGVTFYPSDAMTSEELIRKADQAMYAAKSTGKNQFSLFTEELDRRAHARLRLSNELRQALNAGQLRLHYQPVVDMATGQIAKLEALLRWEHPVLGNIAPATFVPLAEESGLISTIGNWAFREAVGCARRCSERAGRLITIGVNKSPKQFFRQEPEGDWLQYLADMDMPGASIMIEITEGLLLNPSQTVDSRLLRYRDAGVQVAIDDFGTGYSSMPYLHQFDIDYLKIDQSFVHDMETNASHCAIAETIIAMAHKLGLKVIAEGIETGEQLRMLTDAGCNYAQGYLFSPAVPERQVLPMLTTRYMM